MLRDHGQGSLPKVSSLTCRFIQLESRTVFGKCRPEDRYRPRPCQTPLKRPICDPWARAAGCSAADIPSPTLLWILIITRNRLMKTSCSICAIDGAKEFPRCRARSFYTRTLRCTTLLRTGFHSSAHAKAWKVIATRRGAADTLSRPVRFSAANWPNG